MGCNLVLADMSRDRMARITTLTNVIVSGESDAALNDGKWSKFTQVSKDLRFGCSWGPDHRSNLSHST